MAAKVALRSWWWPLSSINKAQSTLAGQVGATRYLHLQKKDASDQNGFKLIEYNSGPCTADKIIIQADKYADSLVECVSSDFAMDKGLVKQFKYAFGHKDLLKEKGTPLGKAAAVPYKDCFIYYLVIRERWWDRGCYKYLRSALKDMRDHGKVNGVETICMGRLGSGADGLDWAKVREVIEEIFKDSDITIKAQLTR